MNIDILLATFNGANYLEELLLSIQMQTFPNWKLLVRDDGSRDGTVDLIKKMAQKDSRIVLIEDDSGNLGVSENFAKLLTYSDAPLIMFADQDDVWFPEKIQMLMDDYLKCDQDRPVLVHCDAIVTDSDLMDSGRTFLYGRGKGTGLGTMIYTGFVQGASMMINRPLKDLVSPLPRGVMYDYYIALVCEVFGIRKLLGDPGMKYRIHEHNVVAKPTVSFTEKICKALNANFHLAGNGELATIETFLNNYEKQLESQDVNLLKTSLDIAENRIPKSKQLANVIRLGLSSDGSVLKLVMKILMSGKRADNE